MPVPWSHLVPVPICRSGGGLTGIQTAVSLKSAAKPPPLLFALLKSAQSTGTRFIHFALWRLLILSANERRAQSIAFLQMRTTPPPDDSVDSPFCNSHSQSTSEQRTRPTIANNPQFAKWPIWTGKVLSTRTNLNSILQCFLFAVILLCD